MRPTEDLDDLIQVASHGAVCELVLNRPPVNALNSAMYEAMSTRFDFVGRSEFRVLVISANGEKAFSAGADLKEIHMPNTELETFTRINHVTNELEALPQITIAAIEEAILGGGLELALACDLRVASSHATFAFPEVGLGDFPGTGGTLRLPWLIGEARARELLLTGERISARRACAIGLISRVTARGQARNDAVAWASKLAEMPVSGVRAIKQSVTRNRTLDAASGASADAKLSSIVNASSDAVEGRRRFANRGMGIPAPSVDYRGHSTP